MAEALARGFIKGGILKASRMIATDPLQSRRDVFKSFDVATVAGNIEVGASTVELGGVRAPRRDYALASESLCAAEDSSRVDLLLRGGGAHRLAS